MAFWRIRSIYVSMLCHKIMDDYLHKFNHNGMQRSKKLIMSKINMLGKTKSEVICIAKMFWIL